MSYLSAAPTESKVAGCSLNLYGCWRRTAAKQMGREADVPFAIAELAINAFGTYF